MSNSRIFRCTKGTFKAVSTIGTTLILANFIKAITPKDISPIKKIAIISGELILSDMLMEAVGKHTDGYLEKIIKTFDKLFPQ